MIRKRGGIALLSAALYLWMPGSLFHAEDVLPGNFNPGTGGNPIGAVTLVKTEKVYYDPTIQGIILNDCGRCHSGAVRNLTDYDSLKMYADSGLLAAMVQGPMSGFAGNDAQTIVDWVQQGAPEKPAAKAAAFAQRPGGGRQNPGSGPVMLVKTQKVYYDPTIKGIILNDCGRCHSGTVRNLTDYDSLKADAESGLLAAMVQGPMRRFAGNDVQTIVDWVRQGAPEKPAAKAAAFAQGPVGGGGRHNPGGGPGSHFQQPAVGGITYTNTVQSILAKDCLRCHSGQFRNMTTYEQVKVYADNGLLKTLVMPGGPMHRFAGPDTREIVAWVNSGAPL